MRVLAIVTLLWLHLVSAKRILQATALVPCLENSGVSATKFNVTFDPNLKQLDYDVSVNVAISGYVRAVIVLYAYGFSALTESVDPCSSSTSIKQLCPLTAGEINIQASTALSDSVVNDIPGIAYTVPDIDAFAIVKVYPTDSNDEIACLRVEFSNGKTVSQTAVKWVTAIICGLGLLVSALFNYYGSPWTSQHIAAATALMFQFFQSQTLLNMEAVERVPPMANSWNENLSWSVGLVYSKFLEKIFRWYVQATGGDPSTYTIYPTVAVIVQKLRRRFFDSAMTVHETLAGTALASAQKLTKAIPPRVADWLDYTRVVDADSVNVTHRLGTTVGHVSNFVRRENQLAQETYAVSSPLLIVYRGIKRVGYGMGIEDTSIVLTALTIYIFACVCVAFIFGVLAFIFFFMRRSANFEKHRHASMFAPALPDIFKGMILRLVFMSFPAVMTLCLWEFIERDSAAVIVTAVIFIILSVAITTWTVFKVWRRAKDSERETGTAAYLLYNDSSFRHRYGFTYALYDANHIYFIPITLGYNLVKAAFLAFAQSSGQTQGMALFIIELAMLVLVCWKKPYLDRSTNIVSITMQVILTVNALFYLFFSNLLTQPLAVNSVMGVIYFVLNAAFSLILLLYTIIYSVISVFRSNPDAHLAPAKDDRHSFIEEKGVIQPNDAGELTALGAAAQADHEDQGEHPDWFETDNNAGPMDLPVPNRNSRHLEQRANTMMSSNSIPTLGGGFAFSDSFNAGHRRPDSQTSFGLGGSTFDDEYSTPSGGSSAKKGGNGNGNGLKFWKR